MKMKKKLEENFILISLLISLVLNNTLWAQGGRAKNLTTGNKWIYVHYEYGQPEYEYYEIVTGDTTINDKLYAKIEQIRDPNYDPILFFERADSSKIYWIVPWDSTERIQCDFHVNVGDTVIHTVVDSVVLYSLVTAVYEDTFWGCQRTFVEMFHEFSYLYYESSTYAEGIGMIYLSAGGLAVQDFTIKIKGGVLNNVAYGDTFLTNTSLAMNFINPNSFLLYQNYPNPFNGSTTIAYHLGNKTPQKVRLTIYDLSGKEVRRLVDILQNEGGYEVNWDGRNQTGKEAPSGIYLCSLIVGNLHQVKKLILTR